MNTKNFYFLILAVLCLNKSFAMDSTKTNHNIVTTPVYTSTDTEPTAVKNEDYASLFPCPADPICPKSPSHPGVAPINTAECPKDCIITREVKNVEYAGITRVASSTSPVCPKGYVALSMYNLDREIKQDPSPPSQYPIPSEQIYQQYKSDGGTCVLGAQAGTTSKCAKYTQGSSLEINDLIEDKYGKYKVINVLTRCYSTANCTGNLYTCGGGIDYTTFTLSYSWYTCTPPSGLYYTQNLIPISTVCTRLLMKYKTGN